MKWSEFEWDSRSFSVVRNKYLVTEENTKDSFKQKNIPLKSYSIHRIYRLSDGNQSNFCTAWRTLYSCFYLDAAQYSHYYHQ